MKRIHNSNGIEDDSVAKRTSRENVQPELISLKSDNENVLLKVNTTENELLDLSVCRIPRLCMCNTSTSNKLNDSFFDMPCEFLAKGLIGKVLVRSIPNGTTLRGRIVETECYLGGIDKASHSYNGKITPRNKPMYMKPGTTYVYFTYGMYFCFNISSQGDGAAVLLRALDPLEGHQFMNQQRMNRRMKSKRNQMAFKASEKPTSSSLKPHELCNGPGKLCISFDIDDKSCNMKDLCTWDNMWIETDRVSENIKLDDLVTSTRIGLNSVEEEWALKPLRFYLYGNRSVSKRDKVKEQEIMR